jgi:hypothetical protein
LKTLITAAKSGDTNAAQSSVEALLKDLVAQQQGGQTTSSSQSA